MTTIPGDGLVGMNQHEIPRGIPAADGPYTFRVMMAI
jgi:hypothetical protein